MSGRTASGQGSTRTPIFSPPSSSPATSQRKHRLPSGSIQPFTDYYRRPSGLQTRKSSQASASGTSTPYGVNGPTRKRKGVAVPGGETDWSSVDADEVFRRLPVGEVKRVEAKMRDDASNKQSELRSMVGTRYRDLLTSATQITALRESSLRLSSSLRTATSACSSPQDIGVSSAQSDQSEGEEVMSLLPVAAHVKLLLDAPEALYSLLAHQAYLKAAYLWLVARVAKESLSSTSEELSSTYTPLLQKQWEILAPFRNQIATRAQASLRSRDAVDSKTLSDTLLAIILLDNLSLPDALSLFLTQRSKALRDILHSPESPSSAQHPRLRRDSKASIRSINKDRDDIGSVLAEALKSVLNTVALARAVFDKRKGAESLIDEMQRLVQVGETVETPKAPGTTGGRRTSHERRASRLASISIAMPKIAFSASGPPVSSAQVLQNLPSAQILLRHLPSSITGFTPFIAPSPAPEADEKLASWQASAIGLLREAVPGWLAGVHSVADVWKLRGDLNALLAEGQLENDLKESLEDAWNGRVEQVWDERLKEAVELVETKTREAGEDVRAKGTEADANPESFIFTDLPFPPAPAHALTASAAPFNAFLANLQKRSALRTPLLDSVLVELEQCAKELRADISGLPSSLYASYAQRIEESLAQMVKALQRVADSMGPSRGDGKAGIEAEMFVGRVGIYVAKQSQFLADLVGEAGVSIVPTQDALVELHAGSVVRWRAKAVGEATAALAPIFDPLIGSKEVRSSWQGASTPTSPSSAASVALHILVQATRQLGLPPASDLPIVKQLLDEFVETARSLEGWAVMTEERAAQAAFDLAFLAVLAGQQASEDVLVKKQLGKLQPDCPSDYADNLPILVQDHLRRSQLLLSPLIRHLKPPSGVPAPAADTRNGLLRFGAPKGNAGVGTEFRSPLAVAKPGKRFGLLSIAA